jgi:hypothetical protein
MEVFAFPAYSFAPPAAMIRYLKDGRATGPGLPRMLKRKGWERFLNAAVSYPASITQLINPP